jgi:DNA-directed RNA polymerase subunit H (RpoH/RPB5)
VLCRLAFQVGLLHGIRDGGVVLTRKDFDWYKYDWDKDVSEWDSSELFEVLEETKHIYMPKAAILSEKEKGELLKKYAVAEGMLPKMKKSDPGAKNLPTSDGKGKRDAAVGEVVRIERVDPPWEVQSGGFSVKYYYYRLIV